MWRTSWDILVKRTRCGSSTLLHDGIHGTSCMVLACDMIPTWHWIHNWARNETSCMHWVIGRSSPLFGWPCTTEFEQQWAAGTHQILYALCKRYCTFQLLCPKPQNFPQTLTIADFSWPGELPSRRWLYTPAFLGYRGAKLIKNNTSVAAHFDTCYTRLQTAAPTS